MSKKALCRQLWESLPQNSLLILDRYYGQAPMVRDLQQCAAHASHFLVCVRDKLNVKVQRTCADDSAEVEVTLRESGTETEEAAEVEPTPRPQGRQRKHPRQKVSKLTVREVRGRLRGSNGQWTEVLRWTSLEVRQAGALRISFALCQEYTAALFLVLQSSQGLMDAPAQAELVRRVRAQIAQAALPPRRQRNCQRKVRGPVNKWPRTFAPTSLSLPKQFEVTSIA